MTNKKKVKAGRKGGIMGTGLSKTRTTEHYRLAGIQSGIARRAKKGEVKV